MTSENQNKDHHWCNHNAGLLLQNNVEIHITTGISLAFTLLLANITTLMGITAGL